MSAPSSRQQDVGGGTTAADVSRSAAAAAAAPAAGATAKVAAPSGASAKIQARRRSSSGKTTTKKSRSNTSAEAASGAGGEGNGGFLRSLRNIFFGKRTRRPVSVAVTGGVPRAKSTEALNQSPFTAADQATNADSRLSGKHADARRLGSVPYSKVFSVSADDLLGSSQWIVIQSPSPGRVSASCSSAENLDGTSSIEGGKASVSSMDDLSSDTDVTAAGEFFNLKWSEHVVITTDNLPEVQEDVEAPPVDEKVPDLDTVTSKNNLNVTVTKDRLAVKQKGKRQSAALQQKINLANKHSVGGGGPAGWVLPPVAEDRGEEASDVTKEYVIVSRSNSGRIIERSAAAATVPPAAATDSQACDNDTEQQKTSRTSSPPPPAAPAAASRPPVAAPFRPLVSPTQLADALKQRRDGRGHTCTGTVSPPRDHDAAAAPPATSPKHAEKSIQAARERTAEMAAPVAPTERKFERRTDGRHPSGEGKTTGAGAAPTAPAGATSTGAKAPDFAVAGVADRLDLPTTKPKPRPKTMAHVGGGGAANRATMFVETGWLSGVQRRIQEGDKE